MASATLTSKGQVTIPIEVRRKLHLRPGDRVEFICNEESGRCEVIAATISVLSLKGIVPKPSKPVSIAEMNAAIARMGASTR